MLKIPNYIFLVTLIATSCRSDIQSPLKFIGLEATFEEVKKIDVSHLDISFSYAYQPTNSDNLYFSNSDFDNELFITQLNLNDFSVNNVLNIPVDFFLEAYTIDESNAQVFLFSGDSMYVYTFASDLFLKIPFGEIENGFLSTQNHPSFRPIVDGDQIYIGHFPDIIETYKSTKFYRQPTQAVVELKSQKVKLLPHFYPEEYQQKCYGFNFIPDRFIDNNKNHVFSFPFNDTAYVFNSDGLIEKFYFGTSQQHKFSYVPFERIKDLESAVFQNLINANPYYGFSQNLFYSKYFTRLFISAPKSEVKMYSQVFYNHKWEYIGELISSKPYSFFDSSKHGLLSINFDGTSLTLSKVVLN
jgi:hypothetical protein